MAQILAVEMNTPAAPYMGRLAPSPTGALHLGNVRTFMIAWLRARSQGGRILMRMEDLDHPHNKPGAAAAAVEDLRWLGFDWDVESVQSQRRAVYRDAIRRLADEGFAYPCVCTRADVEHAQSAPHAGEQRHYPGTCRGRFDSWDAAAAAIAPRVPVWRFRADHPALAAAAPGGIVSFVDGFAGPYSMDVPAALGDFPLARDRDGAGFMLASAVDDCLQGVTEIVRGDDLLPAAPAQIFVAAALGLKYPALYHVPLVVGDNGMRLAKRHGDTRVRAFRESGVAPEALLGRLAWKSGIAPDPAPRSLRNLLEIFNPADILRRPLVILREEWKCS